MIDASVVIPTYNQVSLLEMTLYSVLKQSLPDDSYEVIVVDNASTDNTKDLVADLAEQHKNLIYVYEESIGYQNAIHAGAKAAKGKILIYTDDDAVCDKNLLLELLKPYDDPQVACVGGKILPKWEIEPPKWVGHFPPGWLSLLDEGEKMKEIKWIYGTNFSVRKTLMFELGGFNPGYTGDKRYSYSGDSEIGLLRKVHAAGKKVIYNPKAIVWHFIPKSRLTVDYFRKRAFSIGIEASFCEYCYHTSGKVSKLKLMRQCAAFGVRYGIHNIKTIITVLSKNSDYYKHVTSSSRYKARCLYALKLMFDKKLREVAKKTKWLE